MSDDIPESTTQRTALLVLWLKNGERLTVAEIARRLGISRAGVYLKLDQISVLPGMALTCVAGVWFLRDGEKSSVA